MSLRISRAIARLTGGSQAGICAYTDEKTLSSRTLLLTEVTQKLSYLFWQFYAVMFCFHL
jgi:hypothetical protein